jgi:glycosyltransferase involved in cell wall biosynthesis
MLLVDDTPEPANRQLEDIARRHGARVLKGESHVGGKRNLGAREARYEFVLFLDSDVEIQPGLLRAHHDALSAAAPKVAGCLGKVEFVGEPTFSWRVIAEMQLTLPFAYPDVAEAGPWGPTANISFRKTAFFTVGGFDTTLPLYGGEDVDLGLRLTREGYVIVTSRTAVAHHAIQTWSTWRQNLERLYRFGQADFHLLLRHPERSFLDFPTGPILWLLQLVAGIVLMAVRGWELWPAVLVALLLSVLAYHVGYAMFKKQRRSSFWVHLAGPFIFYTMDLAKIIEAIRYARPGLILRRVKFLDDLIAQDWREVAASTWGLAASAFAYGTATVFLVCMELGVQQ